MRMKTFVRGLGLVALLSAAACKSLDITNPNEPDSRRALADPQAIEALIGGGMSTWINTYEGLTGGGPLITQAQTNSASWNNFNINFYSGLSCEPIAAGCVPNRDARSWQNNPAASARTSIEHYWTGYYSALALVTDVLRAVRNNGLVINTAGDTKRAEAMAQFVAGAALSGIAMNYDQGYVIDETTDLSTLAYQNRKIVRDAARAKLDDCIAIASANTFTTPTGWANGPQYTNVQIAQACNTMAAYLLASYPRDAAEATTQVDWAAVVTYASNGISATTPFTFSFESDGGVAWYNEHLTWTNSMDTFRVHTRIANMLDPTHLTPYPVGGNPPPNSLDMRLGNGAFGSAAMVAGFGNIPITAGNTAGKGSDFAYSTQQIFNQARGTFHQSNIAHIRYDLSGVQAPTGIYGGYGFSPLFSPAQNDLLWAEGLLRQNLNLALAATKINNTRVTRGGLPAAAAGDGQAVLLQRLSYEMEMELLGLGAASYYHRRRAVGGLIAGTPREMPVPAKELGVFGQPLYTWGGATPNSVTPP